MPIYGKPNLGIGEAGRVLASNGDGSWTWIENNPYDSTTTKVIGVFAIYGTTPITIETASKEMETGKTYRLELFCDLLSSQNQRFCKIDFYIDGEYLTSSTTFSPTGNFESRCVCCLYDCPTTDAYEITVQASCERGNQNISLSNIRLNIQELV